MEWIYECLPCNMKSSGKYKRWKEAECTLHHWPKSWERSVVVLDHFRNFKGILLIVEYNIKNEEGTLIQEEGNYCLELKKGKLKTKKLLKITRYIKWTRALSNISRASPKLRKYVFTLTWKGGITASISENKYLLGFMPERIPSNNIWK